MPPKGERLVPLGLVDGYKARVAAAFAAAGDVQRRNVARALTANGLKWSDPARSTSVPLWDQSAWANAVEANVVPVARTIAGEILAVVRARVDHRLRAGMPNPTDQLVAMARDRALSGGPGISRRLTNGLVASGGAWYFAADLARDRAPFAKKEIDVEAIRAKVMNAPDRYGGVVHPESLPTVADAYQAAYDALSNLVEQTGAHLSDAASAILAETMDQNTSAQVQHVWNCAMLDTSREDHVEADGQVQDAGDAFDVGGEDLMYPGDPSGSDENICNCLCWLDIVGVELADAPAADEEAG